MTTTRKANRVNAATTKAKASRAKVNARRKASATAAKVLELEQIQATAKELYAEMDRLQLELIDELGTDGERITLPDGREAYVVNNYLDKNGEFRNVAFRPCGVKMFEVKVK